jgi:hypothetical protein
MPDLDETIADAQIDFSRAQVSVSKQNVSISLDTDAAVRIICVLAKRLEIRLAGDGRFFPVVNDLNSFTRILVHIAEIAHRGAIDASDFVNYIRARHRF